jgi:hypothetical protein
MLDCDDDAIEYPLRVLSPLMWSILAAETGRVRRKVLSRDREFLGEDSPLFAGQFRSDTGPVARKVPAATGACAFASPVPL